MSDTVVAALIGAAASALSSIVAFVVGIRRSLRASNEAIESRLEYLQSGQNRQERRLERIEASLADVREALAYERGRAGSPLGSPSSTGRSSRIAPPMGEP